MLVLGTWVGSLSCQYNDSLSLHIRSTQCLFSYGLHMHLLGDEWTLFGWFHGKQWCTHLFCPNRKSWNFNIIMIMIGWINRWGLKVAIIYSSLLRKCTLGQIIFLGLLFIVTLWNDTTNVIFNIYFSTRSFRLVKTYYIKWTNGLIWSIWILIDKKKNVGYSVHSWRLSIIYFSMLFF